jgi:hypothetical protein
MITVFTPLLPGDGGGLVSAASSTSERTPVLGGLLALYPPAQFFGAPVLGSLSDRLDPGAALGLGVAVRNVGAAFARGKLRPVFAANFALYLAIFGFFRVYPMYLVDHFGMGVGRESEFIAWVAVPIVLANLFLVGWLSGRMDPRRLTARFGAALAVCLAAVIVPHPEGALWITLFACSPALAICLPSMAAIVSDAVGPAEQGHALGTNQSLQVGAEGLSGLAGGDLDCAAAAGDGRAGGARVGAPGAAGGARGGRAGPRDLGPAGAFALIAG